VTAERRYTASLVTALVAALLAGCSTSTPASVSPAPSAAPSQTDQAVSAPTPRLSTPPPALMPVPTDFRLEGPWEVVFSAPGLERIREVFVMTPTCKSGPCDVNVVIQDFSGHRLGTGTFRFDEGVYRLEASQKSVVTCTASSREVGAGATSSTVTTLAVAGYRPSGTAVVSVRVQGERQVAVTPIDGSGCAEVVASYDALGEPTRFAAARPTPRPTPKPTERPSVKAIKASYFGSGVTVKTYRVKGSSPYDISRSILKEGPYSDWLDRRAAGMTEAKPAYRFHFQPDGYGGCAIVIEKKPAIKITYTIILPRWKAGDSTPASTITWWNGHIRGIAKHEKVHVDLYRAAAKKLNSVLASSSCSNATKRLNRVWAEVNRKQCEFDMKEYGREAGLSLKACLAR